MAVLMDLMNEELLSESILKHKIMISSQQEEQLTVN